MTLLISCKAGSLAFTQLEFSRLCNILQNELNLIGATAAFLCDKPYPPQQELYVDFIDIENMVLFKLGCDLDPLRLKLKAIRSSITTNWLSNLPNWTFKPLYQFTPPAID